MCVVMWCEIVKLSMVSGTDLYARILRAYIPLLVIVFLITSIFKMNNLLCSLIESVHPMFTSVSNNYYVRHKFASVTSCEERYKRQEMCVCIKVIVASLSTRLFISSC